MATPPGTVRDASHESPRSDFVTVVGCFAIAAAILAVLFFMLTALIMFGDSGRQRGAAIPSVPANDMGVSVLQYAIAHPELLLYALWIVSVATLVASIELL